MSLPAHRALSEVFGPRLLIDADRRRPYETPERGAPGYCAAVILVQTQDEVQQALQVANTEGLRYVLSAGRTGLVEAQRPQGEIVLSLERLRRVLGFELADGRRCDLDTADIDAASVRLLTWWTALGQPDLSGSTITAEAGLAVDALNQVLGAVGRMFPMEMGSTASASIGACVANASAGANAVCYGTAAHMATAARGYWGDASATGPWAAPQWVAPAADRLAIDSMRLPADWGLVGSQGVFGVITEVTLRTQAIPRAREGVLLAVSGMPQAMDILSRARPVFGADIEEFEFLSRSAMQLVLRRKGDDLRLPFDPIPTSPYLVLLQVRQKMADDTLAERLYEFCSGVAGLADPDIGYAPLPVLKKLRHSVTEASNLETRALGAGRLSFDTATPLVRFGAYLQHLAESLRELRPDLQLIDFGHAGVGGAHLHLIGGAGRPLAEDAAELTRRVIDITLQAGGTFSAEHGVGPKWALEVLARTPRAQLQEWAARKRRHDPALVLQARSFGFDRLLAA